MRKKKKIATADAEAAGGSRRGVMLPAATVAAAVLVAGFVMQGGAPAASPAPSEKTPHPVEGPVVEMEPVTLNLSDGYYLRVGVALQLAAPPDDSEGEGEEGVGTEEFPTAKASDLIVATFPKYTKKQLSSPRGREAAKKLLSERIVDAYGGAVTGMYLTSFVMQ